MLSVLLPVRNAEATLGAALKSLQRQSFRDWECLVVDDGSTDGTPAVLRDFSNHDSRFRILRGPACSAEQRGLSPRSDAAGGGTSQDNSARGIVPALQWAAMSSERPYLARMDADDVSHPRRFERQLEFLNAHPEISLLSCRIRHFPRHGLGSGLCRYETWLNALRAPSEIARQIFVESPVAHPSVMLRRSAFEAVGGYRDTPWAEDYDLWLRLHAQGYGMAKLDACLFFWRQGKGRLSFTDARYSPENFSRAKAQYLAPRLPAGRPVAIWGAGPVGRRMAKLLAERGATLECLIDIDPRRIGQKLLGLPVRSPECLVGRPDLYVLAAVQRPGAREAIEAHLREKLGRCDADFLPVA